ncbi:MAG: hypothetical protein R3D00_23665 [Bacteroidia bacterium]
MNAPLHRYAATLRRIEALTSLQKMVALPPESDISPRQWNALNHALHVSAEKLEQPLTEHIKVLLRSNPADMDIQRKLYAALGETELRLTKAYKFFDMYADILSQRLIPGLGSLLAGCDALAQDALYRNHPALHLVEPPLVHVDPHFGASIARQDVRLPDGTANPMAMIQIPYSRILEKWNLTSILHEAGHEVMVRLGMVGLWPQIVGEVLKREGGSSRIQHLFGMWMSEIGPDFWTFGCSGIAAAGGIRELLILPPAMMTRVSDADPHPPPWLRVLLNFEWCRQVWGKGIWDIWEEEWLNLFPLENLPEKQVHLLETCRKYLPVVSRAMFTTRLKVLSGKPMTVLFDLENLHPAKLQPIAASAKSGKLTLRGLRPSAQLAVFRLVKESQYLSPENLDKVMGEWLKKLKHFVND